MAGVACRGQGGRRGRRAAALCCTALCAAAAVCWLPGHDGFAAPGGALPQPLLRRSSGGGAPQGGLGDGSPRIEAPGALHFSALVLGGGGLLLLSSAPAGARARPSSSCRVVAAAAAATGASTSTKAKTNKEVKDAQSSDVPEDLDWNFVSEEWEVDCFSRPVLREGKKMWELLLTDENAVYRRVAQMKPTRVNSVVVQKLIQIFIEESKVKPKVIRFYRKVMKNMLTVALENVKENIDYMNDLRIQPTRTCHMLRQWLAYREREVYPKMDGFLPTPKRRASAVQASMVQMSYEPLPKKINFMRYVVAAIPLGALARVKPGQLPGQLCLIPPGFSDNELVHGVVIMTSRADIISSLLKTMELSAIKFDLATSELVMDLGIDTTYRIEKVPTEDKDGCVQFERAKRNMAGLHFVAVHNPFTGGEPNLPIEVDGEDDSPGEGCITGLWMCIDYSPTDEQ